MTAPSPLISLREALEAAWAPGGKVTLGPYLKLVHAGYPPNAVLYKLNELANRGLLDYGVNVAYAWLTEEGEQRLAELREKGD
jgi:hypothetical protein